MTNNYHDLHNDLKTLANMTNDEIKTLKNILQKPYVRAEEIFYLILEDEMEKRGLKVSEND